MRSLELLAPAKNLKCGIAAIDCGADAVYVGAPKFGARAAAGNSVDDIRVLADYAHQFRAKVYVTLNTIIYDAELEEAKSLFRDIVEAGADAVLVQDAAMLAMADVGVPLHASTQCDCRDRQSVGWLRSLGFSRVVLARELSLAEIRDIHDAYPDLELEAFVHGALCASYSGACYASQHCFRRSANRGECMQFCRMKFDLLDADGKVLQTQRHLLSLKDLCLIDHLEELADAGVVSFKIEGRLKDEAYCKNVTAAYSERLDDICRRRPDEYRRSSLGRSHIDFAPNLAKTFNRGFTTFFINGRQPGIYSPDTPKAVGECIGGIKETKGHAFTLKRPDVTLRNGDGLCFFSGGDLKGFRVNRVDGDRIVPFEMPQGLSEGTMLYRNNDVAFVRQLAKSAARRKLPIRLSFSTTPDGFRLEAAGEGLEHAMAEEMAFDHQLAQKPQRGNIVAQLTRWGNTKFEIESVNIAGEADRFFVPSSLLSELRRRLVQRLAGLSKSVVPHAKRNDVRADPPAVRETGKGLTVKNVSNHLASEEYRSRGIDGFIEALEVNPDGFPLPLMQCRHCLRYALGHCVRYGGTHPKWKEPLSLRLGDGRRFTLEFDCKHCQMNVHAT